MWLVALGVFLYLLLSLIQFYFSLYRKHRRAVGIEKVLDAFFYPGFMTIVTMVNAFSTLLRLNK